MLAQYVRKWRDNHCDRTRSTTMNHHLETAASIVNVKCTVLQLMH